jgi:hypothetical protein
MSVQEGVSAVEARKWPPLLDTDDPPKVKNLGAYRPPSADATCYIDFSVSTTGMLAGIKVTSFNFRNNGLKNSNV